MIEQDAYDIIHSSDGKQPMSLHDRPNFVNAFVDRTIPSKMNVACMDAVSVPIFMFETLM